MKRAGTRANALAAAVALATAVACGGSDRPPAAGPGLEVGDRPGERRTAVPHDDDDDDDPDLHIEGLRGRLEPAAIQRGIAPHAAGLERCYTANLGKRRYIGGRVELGFRVTREGTVKLVQVSQSDLGAWEIERCMLDLARQMTFERPRGGEAEFSLPLDFSPTGGSQWWDEERAADEVDGRRAEVVDCAAEAGAPEPRNVWVTLYVGTRGQVQSVGFASPAVEPIDDAWAECVAERVKAWTLSDPRGRIAKMSFRYNPE